MNILKSKKFKHGSLSVLFTVIFIVAIILVNVIFNLLLSRFDFTTDLSDQSLYSIEDSTAEYLKTVDDKVTIIVAEEETSFVNSGNYYKQVAEVISRFAETNSNFDVRYYDANSNPDIFAKYGTSVTEGSIIVESQQTGMYRIITPSDYLDPVYYFNGEEVSFEEAYYYSQFGYGSYITSEYNAAAERCLLSATMIVTDDDPTQVAVLTGFGESASTTITEMLETNVYSVEELDISMASEISSDIDVLLILCPLYDYSNDALDLIDRWLDNGGSYGKTLVYVPSISNFDTPNLDAFLADWGLEIGDGYLCQTDDNYAYQAGSQQQLLVLEDTDYAEDVDVYSKSTLGDMMRPVNLLFDAKNNYETLSIVKTYDGNVIKPYNAGDAWKTSDAKEVGAYTVVAESSKVMSDGTNLSYSRVFAIGGEAFVCDSFLKASQTNNDEIFMSILNKATGKDETEITITTKSFSLETFEITGAQANTIAVIFCIVVPVLVIGAGVAVVIRRKRR